MTARAAAPLSRAQLLTAAGIAAAGAVTGLAIHHGPRTALLAIGMLGLAALTLTFAQLGPAVLLAWAPLSVIAQPLNGFLPGVGGQQLVTFDRVWVLAMIGVLLALPRPTLTSRRAHALCWALALLCATVAVRTAFTDLHGDFSAWNAWIDALVLPLILFCVSRRVVALRQGAVERIATSLMAAGGIMAAIGIAEHFVGFELATLSGSTVRLDQTIGEVRISGPFGVPEVYGLSLVLCLGATLLWLGMRPRPFSERVVGWALVAMQATAIFLTFFRVGWIAALVVVAAAAVLRSRLSARALVRLALIGLVLALAGSQLEHISAVSSRLGNTQTIAARLATYKQAVEIWRLEPLTGVGMMRYTPVALSLPREYVDGVASVEFPHSSFLGVLAEAGVVGLAALLLAVAMASRAVRALRKRAATRPDRLLFAVVAGTGVAYLAYSLTLTMLPYGPSNAFFAILLGLVAGRLDALARVSRTPAGKAT